MRWRRAQAQGTGTGHRHSLLSMVENGRANDHRFHSLLSMVENGRANDHWFRALFFEFASTVACHERSSLGAKRYEATSSRSDGKLKSIAENRSGVEVNLQQGEDHRRPWSNAARVPSQQQPEKDRCFEDRSTMTAAR